VARYGWSTGRLSCAASAVMVLWLASVSAAKVQPDPKAQKPKAPDATQTLNAVVEAQRPLAVGLSELREQLSELQRNLSEARDEIRQNHDTIQGQLDQIKGMREEVRGLYVESSGLKGDIAQVGKQVEDLEGSLGNFRLSSGIVVAVVIVLQVVLMGLMFRGRG
jgi:peptidoglycan hydrolase CwlO-like protein